MQLADGCGSGTLYKCGNLKTYNLAILPMFILGAFAATLHFDWWLNLGTLSNAINLNQQLGGYQYLGLQVAILIALYCAGRWYKSHCPNNNQGRHQRKQLNNIPRTNKHFPKLLFVLCCRAFPTRYAQPTDCRTALGNCFMV